MSDKDLIKDPQEQKTANAKKIADKSKISGPFESLEELIVRFFRWISSLIDKLFFTKGLSAFFALVLACVAFFVVNYDEESFHNTLSSSKTISNISVTARYNSESFEVSGLPTSCNITFTGDAANVNNASSKNGYCLINMDGYTEGTHTIDLVASGYGDNVSTIISPSQVQVTLKRKTTAQFDISYDYINKNQLDSKYILGIPEFSSGSSKVNIRASQDTLNSIALVKALIDVSNQTGDFEVEVPLVAYDSHGSMVNAEIVPNSIKAKVSITSPHKTVPIKINISGEAPAGFSLENVITNHQTTEIYASEEVLSKISEVYINLDLSTITSDSEIIQPVILPAGVSSSEITMVNLQATLGQSVKKEIEDVTLNSINNDNGYGISYADTLHVSLVVSGTQNNIDAVDVSDFYAYVDFAGLEPGTYNLPIMVNNNADAYVSVEVSPQNLNITLVSQE